MVRTQFSVLLVVLGLCLFVAHIESHVVPFGGIRRRGL